MGPCWCMWYYHRQYCKLWEPCTVFQWPIMLSVEPCGGLTRARAREAERLWGRGEGGGAVVISTPFISPPRLARQSMVGIVRHISISEKCLCSIKSQGWLIRRLWSCSCPEECRVANLLEISMIQHICQLMQAILSTIADEQEFKTLHKDLLVDAPSMHRNRFLSSWEASVCSMSILWSWVIDQQKFLDKVLRKWKSESIQREKNELHKNIERHTAGTIVSWSNPKQWVIVHTSDLMMIKRQSIYILSIITREMGKLKTYSPTYCIMDNGENMFNLTHTLDKIYLTDIL